MQAQANPFDLTSAEHVVYWPSLARRHFKGFFGAVARTSTDGPSGGRLAKSDGSGDEERQENTHVAFSIVFFVCHSS